MLKNIEFVMVLFKIEQFYWATKFLLQFISLTTIIYLINNIFISQNKL